MSKVANQPKELKPSDRRLWPAKGDKDIKTTYEAVGRAMSQWERYEGVLSLLFSAFVSGAETKAARRAYNAVRTFEGRAEMLKAVSETYFAEYPDEVLLKKFKEILSNSKQFSERRNDIAHGVVDHFMPSPEPSIILFPDDYCLYPSYANFKHRDQHDIPQYCYTSVELDYFFEEFYKLQEPAATLAGQLLQQAHNRTLQQKLRKLYPPQGSPSSEIPKSSH